MNWRTVFAFILGAAITFAGILVESRQPHRRAVMSVGAAGFDNEIIGNCSSVALANDPDQADYNLVMHWLGDKWYGVLRRHDSVILHRYQETDSSAIIRDACKQVRKDSDWPIIERPRTSSIVKPGDALRDRYELREVRNGSVVTTGLIDKETGQVWTWVKGPDGVSYFNQEEMIPEPTQK